MLTRLLSEDCILELPRGVEAKDARDSGGFNLGARAFWAQGQSGSATILLRL